MKPWLIWVALWLWLTIPGTISAEPAATVTLHLQVSGINRPVPMIILLFRRDGWLHNEQAVQQRYIPADQHDDHWSGSMAGLTPGEYAIEVFLDTNHNGKLDMHWFPIPGPDEPVGFSNNYRPFAKPSFDKAAFSLQAHETTISIRLR